jgi:hypothetical protein
MVDKEHQILSSLEKRYDQALLRNDGIPAMALLAAKVNDEDQDVFEE